MKAVDEIKSIDTQLSEIQVKRQAKEAARARIGELCPVVHGATPDVAQLADKRRRSLREWLDGLIPRTVVDVADAAYRKDKAQADAQAEKAQQARELEQLGEEEIRASIAPLDDEAAALGRRRNTLLRATVREHAEQLVPGYIAAMRAAGEAFAEIQACADMLNAAEHVGYSDQADFQRDGGHAFGGQYAPRNITFQVFSTLPAFEGCVHGAMDVTFSRQHFERTKHLKDQILVDLDAVRMRLRQQFADLGITL